MIDVSQWRASIGLWNYCQAASRGSIVFKKYCRPASSGPASDCCQDQLIKTTTEDSESDSTGYIQEEKRCTLPAILFIIGFIVINFCVLLLKHNSIPPPGHCYCYQVQCTTGDIVTDTLQSVVLPGDINIFSLMSRLLLLLSGDVELNPGPTVEEACKKVKEVLRSHYATLEEATKGSLSSILSHLYAKKIITKTVRDSQSLNYNKMIDEFEAKLLLSKDVSELKRHCQVFVECISQGGPTDDAARSLSIEWGQVFDMESLLPVASTIISSTSLSTIASTGFIHSNESNDTSSTNDLAMTLSLQSVNAGATSHDTDPFICKESEKELYKSLDDLHQKFSDLVTIFETNFEEKSNHNSQLTTDVSKWLIAHMKWKRGSVDSNIDDIFNKIEPYYDFIDCKLLLDMSRKFLQDVTFTDNGVTCKLVDGLQSHLEESERLRTSIPVSAFRNFLDKFYPMDRNMDNLPYIHMQLQTCWDDISIDGLYELIKKLLPREYRQSVMKHIKIRSKCVVVKLYFLDITADSLIEYTGGKLQFMRLIGIFSLYINDHPVLQEDENMNFTFELALLEAVTAGNNEAVEFLLQLETANEEGKTALMLACERGHEDIVHSLLSAGANVNIQDNKGWTALMIASKHNHISIIHMLLQANANPHLKKSDGSNAVMIASHYGNCEVLELLISRGVDYKYQREDGVNAFMLACLNGHTQIVKLLLKEQVDPNVQDKDGVNAFMLACFNGHTQIVEMLLKKQVINDLNVSSILGHTGLMIACCQETEHLEIVKILLQAGANVNIQVESSIIPFVSGATALMMASTRGHKQTVQLLLKAGADPNKAAVTGETALRDAVTFAHYEIVDELIKAGASTNISMYNLINNTTINCTVTQCCVIIIEMKNISVNEMNQAMQNLMPKQLQDNPALDMGLQQIRAQDETKHIKILQLLLEATSQPEDDPYSLIAATAAGCTPAVELLLKAGYDPLALCSSSKLYSNTLNNTNTGDCNALMVACLKGYIEIVKLMLQGPVLSTNMSIYNPIINATIDFTITQYCIIIIAMKIIPVSEINQEMQYFMPKQLQDNPALDMGLQQIRAQDETKHIKILQHLLEATPQPEDDPYSLIVAAAVGCTPAVELLLKAGYDPWGLRSSSRLYSNIFKDTNRSIGDCNALMVACLKGCIEIVQLMLQGPVASTNMSIYNPIINTTINWTITQYCVAVIGMKNIAVNEINEILQNFKLQDDILFVMDMTLQQIKAQDETKYIKILQLLLKATLQPEDDPASLMLASNSGNIQVVELLLKAGYNPKAPLSSSKYFQAILPFMVQTPLSQKKVLAISCPSLVLACIRGHLEVVKLLLKEINDPNHQQETEETFLMLACGCGHKDIVFTLLENGADPNICDSDGEYALHYVLHSNSSEDNILDIIQTLLSENINVNVQNNDGVTPLMIASEKGYTEVLLVLLDEADPIPNITNNKGKTALMLASIKGQSETVALLLMAYNADPSVTDNYQSTALCHAAYNGYNEVINVLLNNYNPNQKEIEKAFSAACYGGHKETIEFLTDKINLTKHQSNLLTACMSDDVELMNNQTTSDLCTPLIKFTGLTPLMIAASCGSDGVVQTLLLVYGADVNQQDTYLNYSPLMYAVSGSKSISMVQYLLDSGANVNAISKDEKTPLDIARHKRLNEIAQILENNGGVICPSVTVDKVEQLSTRQKVELLLGLLMTFSQLHTLPTTANMRESFNIPSFTSVPILPTTMV